MSRNFLNTRLWLITAILIIGIAACIVPAAADSVSYIQITTNPSNGWVCLDHWNCQSAPVTFSTTSNSYHSISVYQDGYQMSTQSVYANDPGMTTNVAMTLASNSPLTGSLDLSSKPTNADIWLDGRYYGTTPQVIGGLSDGDHSLTLKKASYFDFTEPFTIVSSQTSTLYPTMAAYTSSSGYGDIEIQSNPVGAAVYVNNNYVGTTISSTALYVTQLSPGSYSVRVTLANYEPYTETAIVKAGAVYSIQANMVPGTSGITPDTIGQITVRSNPSGANIYLDNAYRGLTPLTLVDIQKGSHTIILKMNGYQDWQSSVNVAFGSSTDVSGTLTLSATPTPTTYVSQLAPMATKSPISLLGIISAIGIGAGAVILFRKRE